MILAVAEYTADDIGGRLGNNRTAEDLRDEQVGFWHTAKSTLFSGQEKDLVKRVRSGNR